MATSKSDVSSTRETHDWSPRAPGAQRNWAAATAIDEVRKGEPASYALGSISPELEDDGSVDAGAAADAE